MLNLKNLLDRLGEPPEDPGVPLDELLEGSREFGSDLQKRK